MRINVTGFTNQQRTGDSRKGVIGLNTLLPTILKDTGHEVIRDDEAEVDLTIISVLDLGSINAANATNCLELLRRENVMIAFDDWNVKGFYGTIDKVLETKKFSKTHHTVDYENVLDHLDVLEKLAEGKYTTIFPAYHTGNHELLGIRGNPIAVDPSRYVDKEVTKEFLYLLPVHASLATKWRDLDKKKYSILNVRGLKEQDVFDLYCRHGIVLSPPHYHDGSGWWRNRYDLANRAHALIVEDENSVMGESYKINRKEVTEKNFEKLFEAQRIDYLTSTMAKDEVRGNLELAIREATA